MTRDPWVPWTARLVPRSYREELVGDAFEEVRRRGGPFRWRARLWGWGFLLVAAVAAWRQVVFDRITRDRMTRGPQRLRNRHMDGALRSDARYAIRTLMRAPGFVLVSVVTLAIGIGGVTAMYSLLYGSLIRPLAYDRAHELVVLHTSRMEEFIPALSKPDLDDVRAGSSELTDLAIWRPWQVTLPSADAGPSRVMGASVDSRFFAILGVSPVLGRPFTEADDRTGHEPVVILSHGYWQRAYGSDASVVGRTIELDGERYRVVGVVPAGFADPLAASFALASPPLWRASPPEFDTINRSWRSFWGLGRLTPGSSLARLDSELAGLARGLAETWPGTNSAVQFSGVPLREHLVGGNRSTIVLLTSAVLLVLVVACANVANLLLTRGSQRSHEHAVRRALGAGRLRIVRPLIIEHGLLALAGLAVGFGVAAAITAISAPWTRDLAALVEIRMDIPVLLGAGAMSLVVALAFGLVPAWQTAAPAGQPAGGPRTVGGPGARLRSGLVMVETALAVTLLVGAGLLVRSYVRMNAVDLGVSVDRTLVATITPSSTRHSTPEALDEVVHEIVARAGQIPGVAAAGVISDRPLSGVANSAWITRPDRPVPAGTAPQARYRTVAGEYFRAAGMRILAGRTFTDRDDGNAPPVIVINEATRELLFPDDEPMGKMVGIMGVDREIVGIVNDVRDSGPTASAPPAVFVPFRQERQEWATRTSTLMVRVDGDDPAGAFANVRRAILDVDARTAVNDMQAMSDVAALVTRATRFRTALLTAFALVALTLAVVGLGGVVAFQVAHRRRELGLRMALGATGGGVVGLLVGQGVRLSAIGAAAGLVVAAFGGRWLGHLLYAVTPFDPIVFSMVPMVFLATAALAALVPAAHAARLHPATILRDD